MDEVVEFEKLQLYSYKNSSRVYIQHNGFNNLLKPLRVTI